MWWERYDLLKNIEYLTDSGFLIYLGRFTMLVLPRTRKLTVTPAYCDRCILVVLSFLPSPSYFTLSNRIHADISSMRRKPLGTIFNSSSWSTRYHNVLPAYNSCQMVAQTSKLNLLEAPTQVHNGIDFPSDKGFRHDIIRDNSVRAAPITAVAPVRMNK